jgi:hypothetical protein
VYDTSVAVMGSNSPGVRTPAAAAESEMTDVQILGIAGS